MRSTGTDRRADIRRQPAGAVLYHEIEGELTPGPGWRLTAAVRIHADLSVGRHAGPVAAVGHVSAGCDDLQPPGGRVVRRGQGREPWRREGALQTRVRRNVEHHWRRA